MITVLQKGGGLGKLLRYYVGVVRKMIIVYHKSWGITSGI